MLRAIEFCCWANEFCTVSWFNWILDILEGIITFISGICCRSVSESATRVQRHKDIISAQTDDLERRIPMNSFEEVEKL